MRKFLANGNELIQVLYEDFKESVELVEWKPCLWTIWLISQPLLGPNGLLYHGHWASCSLLLGNLEIEKRPILVRLIEV